jgi:hypothetical protein
MKGAMTLFTYIVTHDSGFAPNPYHGYCTLATCKPKIRIRAKTGDWVAGAGSVRTVGHDRLVYAMKVAEVIPIERYAADPRFKSKKPIMGTDLILAAGDNLYEREGDRWRRLPSHHHASDKAMLHDLGGQNVLIAETFWYFGRRAPKIPKRYAALIPNGRADRCRFPDPLVTDFTAWLRRTFVPGIQGEPWHLGPPGPANASAPSSPALRKLSRRPRNAGCARTR